MRYFHTFVYCDVSQESTVGPAMYLVYINDIVNLRCKHFISRKECTYLCYFNIYPIEILHVFVEQIL